MKLIEIDLLKSFTHNIHEHPDIKTDMTEYLCKIGGHYFAGRFNRQHYGLNFTGWHNGLQYDEPGTNCSSWEKVWEIKE